MRSPWLLLLALPLVGCTDERGHTSSDGGCTSHYQRVAEGQSVRTLKTELLRKAGPPAVAVRLTAGSHEGGRTYLNLVNDRDRIQLQLELAHRDGMLVARQWLQCID